MIYFDNIIKDIHGTGGISVLFNELWRYLNEKEIPYRVCSLGADFESRVLERYRPFRVDSVLNSMSADFSKSIFHSTYYRVPDKAPKAIVTTVHDFTYEKQVGGIRRLVHSLQKNRAIHKSDVIICVSQNTKDDLLTYVKGVSEDRVKVVLNGVADCFTPLSLQTKNKVIFVGQRGRYKNFTSLVLALSQLPDVSVECVGGGSFTIDEIKLMEKNIPFRYKHLGYVSEIELNRAYNDSLCLVYPSLYEGFGIPILEAFRAGCPVIAVKNSSVPEVAGNAALLIDSGTPDQIKEAILTLTHNESFREGLVLKGFKQSLSFSWNKTAKETLDIYNSLL